MSDPTEEIRKQLTREMNENPQSRFALEAEHGHVWDTACQGQSKNRPVRRRKTRPA
jgi:hypothetical protein